LNEAKIPTLEEIRPFLSSILAYIINYLEFIGTQKPDKKITDLITELMLLQKSLNEAKSPFLTVAQTITYQQKIIPVILMWNKNIEKNVTSFYNSNSEIACLATENATQLAPNTSIMNLIKNFKRFLEAIKVLNETLEKTNLKLLDNVDFYAVFYSQIASTEAVEHIFYEPLKDNLKRYNLESKYDLEEMFSVTSKWKNKDNEFQTDSRMIRNALAHFYYKIDEIDDETVNIIFYPEKPNLMRKFHYKEFFKYIENNKFMFQSFYTIVTLMTLFSNFRVFFLYRFAL